MEMFTINIKGIAHELKIPAYVIDEIALKLGLYFIPENEEVGRVCMAGHPDVRPEYRETFTAAHLHNYIFAMLYLHRLNPEAETVQVPYPADAGQFWDAVQKGFELRQSGLNNKTSN